MPGGIDRWTRSRGLLLSWCLHAKPVSEWVNGRSEWMDVCIFSCCRCCQDIRRSIRPFLFLERDKEVCLKTGACLTHKGVHRCPKFPPVAESFEVGWVRGGLSGADGLAGQQGPGYPGPGPEHQKGCFISLKWSLSHSILLKFSLFLLFPV